MYDDLYPEIQRKKRNYKIITLFVLVGILVILLVMVLTGMITDAKTTGENIMPKMPAKIVPTPTMDPILIPVIIPTETPFPVATYDPQLEYYRTGGKELGEPFIILRENVTGYKSMEERTIVYDYRFMPNYRWYSVSWGDWFTETPQAGNKFLFLFVSSWIEGSNQSQDSRPWGFDWDNFQVQYKNQMMITRDKGYVPPIVINEMSDIWLKPDGITLKNHVDSPGPYGWIIANDRGLNQRAEQLAYMKMGKSNAWTGFIPFQVPVDASASDLKVLLNAGGFGSPYWRLAK